MLIPVRPGNEVSAAVLRRENSSHPPVRLVYNPLIIEHVPEIDIPFEPVRQLLPSILPFAVMTDPGASLDFTPLAKLRQMPGETLRHQFQLASDPTRGCDRADGELDERIGQERRAVSDVVPILSGCFRYREAPGL